MNPSDDSSNDRDARTGAKRTGDTEPTGGFAPWHLVGFLTGAIWPGMLYVLAQTYARDLTGSAADAGAVMAVIGLGALASPVFGSLADRHGAHRIVQIGSLAAVAVAIVVMGTATDEMVFMVAAIVIGVGFAPAMVMLTTFAVGTGLPPQAEAATIASLQRMLFAGQIFGGFAIAWLLNLREQGTLTYQDLFVVCGVVVAAALVLSVFTTRDVARRTAEHSRSRVAEAPDPEESGTFSLKSALTSVAGVSLIVVFLNHVGWIGIVGQYVNFYDGAFGVDSSTISAVNSVAILLSLATIGAVGKWLGRSNPAVVLGAGILARIALAGALVVIGVVLGAPGAAIAIPLVVWVAFRLANPLTEVANPALVARAATGGAARAQASLVTTMALAITVGNLLAGQLADKVGWMALPWQTIIGCGLALVVLHFVLRPRMDAEAATEPRPGEAEAQLTEQELGP